MDKYIDAIKKVSWPKKGEVTSNFGVIMMGIIFFVLYFTVIDKGLSYILNILFT